MIEINILWEKSDEDVKILERHAAMVLEQMEKEEAAKQTEIQEPYEMICSLKYAIVGYE